MMTLPRRHRRAGYFMRETFRVQDGEAVFHGDMLVELCYAELAAIERTLGPSLTRYKRIDASRAHNMVQRGYTHATGLWIDQGRIRYSGPDPMTMEN